MQHSLRMPRFQVFMQFAGCPRIRLLLSCPGLSAAVFIEA